MKKVEDWGEEIKRLSGATVEHDVQGEIKYLYQTTQVQEAAISQLEFVIAYQNQFIERLEAKIKKKAELVTKYHQFVGSIHVYISQGDVKTALQYITEFNNEMDKAE